MEKCTAEELTCRIICKEDREDVLRMAAFVKGHEKSHFLQTPAWAQVKEYWKWRGILVCEKESIVGALSVLIRPLPLGFSLMYAPRGPVCDRNDPAVMGKLFEAAEKLAKQVRALELMLDADEPCTNTAFRELMTSLKFREKEDGGFDNVQAQYVFRLNLEGKTEDEVFAGFHQKTRYNVRTAIRKGVQIRTYPGDGVIPDEELTAFSRIMDETGERDHFIPREKNYYERVFRALGSEAVLFMAYLEDTPIAGTIGVFSGRKGWYLYGASSNQYRNVMPNYLLQWEMVRTTMERGNAVFYDFRGVPGELTEDNPLYGLYRFKKGFGGDYIKFTGLFIRSYHPFLAKCFDVSLRLFRKIRARIRIKK